MLFWMVDNSLTSVQFIVEHLNKCDLKPHQFVKFYIAIFRIITGIRNKDESCFRIAKRAGNKKTENES